MNVVAKCVEVCRRVELQNFVCSTAIRHFHVLPEQVSELVSYDNMTEAMNVWVLEREGQMVGWYDENAMTLAVA